MTQETLPVYGVDDATYQAAGGLEGITRIVDRFYDLMDSLPEAKTLRDMHGDDLTLSRQKLTYFLSGWMGGPKLFAEHFGPINIPIAHSHLHVDENSKNSWLHCMDLALQQLDYPNDFRDYLMQKLAVPAESIRLMSGLHPGHAATKQIP
ncbi:group II truncated hemoglobin [Aurantivibrio plasticivorans]